MKIFLTISTTIYLFFFFLSTNENVFCHPITNSGQNLTCTMNYDGHSLKESQSVEIKGKLYKVEDCVLQRAYHACGSYLLQMVSIACEILDQQKQRKLNHNLRLKRFIPRKLLTEACCETLCTVTEMTRYCP